MTRGCTLGPRGISRPARPVLGSRRPTDHRGSPPALRCPHGPCSRRPSRSCFHLLSPPFRSIILSLVFLLDPGEHHELTRKQRDRSAPSHDRVQAAYLARCGGSLSTPSGQKNTQLAVWIWSFCRRTGWDVYCRYCSRSSAG